MGFAVHSRGADLIGALRSNEAAVLGRAYPLYVVALATEVDDKALAWLGKYAQAIDSLTGHAVAFLLFYNSVRLFASVRGHVDNEGTDRLFHHYLPTLQVPSRAVRGSRALTDYVIRHTRFPDQAFVASQTYESDSVARCLGISASELPCFVFIDDPNTTDYYLLSMANADDELMTRLRTIVGEFYTTAKHGPYLSLLERIDAFRHQEASIQQAIGESRAAAHYDAKHFPSTAPAAMSLLFARDPAPGFRQLRKWLSSVFKEAPPTDLQNQLQALEEDADKIGHLVGARDALGHFIDVLQIGPLTQKDQVNLGRALRRPLRHFVPRARIKTLTLSDTASCATVLGEASDAIESETSSIRARIRRLEESFAGVPLASIRSTLLAAHEKRIEALDQQAAALASQIETTRDQIAGLERPTIGTILRRLKWGDRRTAAISTASALSH